MACGGMTVAALERLRGVLPAATGWEGIYTHFHSADEDPRSAAVQWDRFQSVLATLPRHPPLVHAANSAAALMGPAYAADLVRPGIFLYGGKAGPVGRNRSPPSGHESWECEPSRKEER